MGRGRREDAEPGAGGSRRELGEGGPWAHLQSTVGWKRTDFLTEGSSDEPGGEQTGPLVFGLSRLLSHILATKLCPVVCIIPVWRLGNGAQ